jgi:hypothetical protein
MPNNAWSNEKHSQAEFRACIAYRDGMDAAGSCGNSGIAECESHAGIPGIWPDGGERIVQPLYRVGGNFRRYD